MGEDEVRSGGDEDAQEKEEGPGYHCIASIRLINEHSPKVGLEAPELIISMGEATCIRRPTRQ